jgi:hypothetical protein
MKTNDWHSSRISRLIGINLRLSDLLAFIWECWNDQHPSRIVGLIDIQLRLLDLLASK